MNRVILLGHLGSKPVIQKSSLGKRFATFSLTTNEKRKNSKGIKQERLDWHNVIVFKNQLVDVSQTLLNKGSKVVVEGKIRNRKYLLDDGTEKQTTEIVLNGGDHDITVLSRSDLTSFSH